MNYSFNEWNDTVMGEAVVCFLITFQPFRTLRFPLTEVLYLGFAKSKVRAQCFSLPAFFSFSLTCPALINVFFSQNDS